MATNRMVQLLGQWSNGQSAIYRDLADRIEDLIAEGSLRRGEQLPPERALAAALGCSRGTVVRAFDQLSERELVVRQQGSGTLVGGRTMSATGVPDQFVGERLWMRDGGAVDLLKAIPAILPAVAEEVASIDLAAHTADLETAEPLGWWRLRERIAEHHTRQGMPTSPHQILVTSGAQQAISLAVEAMTRPGDVVLGEEDTWPGLIDSVHHLGGRFEPVAMDARGLVVEDLEAKIDRFRPSLICLNPQHQNPTGTRLPPERVAAVAELASRHRTPVLEDRVAADLGFDRRHLPAIDEHDTGGYGLTATSLCKVAWSGLRLGWLRADAQVVNRLRSHKAVNDMFTASLSQLLGLRLLDRYDELVASRLDRLRPASDMVVDVLRRDLPEWTFEPPRGGLYIWATLPERVSADAFVRHASRNGVLIASGRQFCAEDMDCSNVRIPFTAHPDALAEGLDRLVTSWRSFERLPTAARVV